MKALWIILAIVAVVFAGSYGFGIASNKNTADDLRVIKIRYEAVRIENAKFDNTINLKHRLDSFCEAQECEFVPKK